MNAHHNRLFSLTGIKNMKVSSRRGVHLSGSTLLAFFLLMSIRAAAQVKTMPFDEIRNDTVSFFSNDFPAPNGKTIFFVFNFIK